MILLNGYAFFAEPGQQGQHAVSQCKSSEKIMTRGSQPTQAHHPVIDFDGDSSGAVQAAKHGTSQGN
jgi:hypothetical protein